MEDIELGTLLKKARKEKNLSLADIQEKTKIRKKYLKAIEENDFDIPPGQVYLKVFVKAYAREVDINYEELLKYYSVLTIKEDSETKLHKDYLNGEVVPHKKNKNRSSKKKFITIILIAFLTLFLTAAGIYTYQYFNSTQIRELNQNKVENKADLETDSEILEAENNYAETLNKSDENLNDKKEDYNNKENKFIENELESSLNDSVESDSLNSETETSINQNILNSLEADSLTDNPENTKIIISEDLAFEEDNSENTLDSNQKENKDDLTVDKNNISPKNVKENKEVRTVEFLANDKVWVNVKINDENSFSGILEAETSKKFEFSNKLYIKIGKEKAVKALIDGEEYGPWTGRGEVAEIEMILSNNEIKINNLRN